MQKPINDLCGGKRANIQALRSQHATRKFFGFDQACRADDPEIWTTHAMQTHSRMPRVTGTLTGAKPV